MMLQTHPPAALQCIHASDGYALTFRVWRPPAPPRACVVLLNGIVSHSGWFAPLVDGLVAQGYALVGADRRGSGNNREQRGDAPTAHVLIDDALAIIDAACSPNVPLVVVGWCWGSVLGLNLVRALGPRLAGFVMVAPGLFYSKQVAARAATNEAAIVGAAEDAAVLPAPIDDTMFTLGPHLQGFIRHDPEKLAAITPRFRKHMDKLALGARLGLRALAVPLLCLLADTDEATDNIAVRKALQALDPTHVRIVTLAGRHALQFDAPQHVIAELHAFMQGLA